MAPRIPHAKIRSFIISLFRESPRLTTKALTQRITEEFPLKEVTAKEHIKRLTYRRVLEGLAEGRENVYQLKKLRLDKFTFRPAADRDALRILHEVIAPALSFQGKTCSEILGSCFAAVYSNAVEHSGATEIKVELQTTVLNTALIIRDNGIGIFRKIQKDLDLDDEEQALLDLAKGKCTSDPARHQGGGIFFSCKACGYFQITSGDLVYSLSQGLNCGCYEEPPCPYPSGTEVVMCVSRHAARTMAKIYEQYSSAEGAFTRTRIPVALLCRRNLNPVSRAQARRLLTRLDQFKCVELDFAGIDMMGQAFADEVFRMYAQKHPEIRITAVNANRDILKMVKHVLTGSTQAIFS